jgi:hypothetical protein
MANKFLKYKTISIVSLISILTALGALLWAYFSLRGVGGPLILHFDDIEGITSVGSIGNLLFTGFLGTLITFINSFLAVELEDRDPFLGKLVAGLTLIFAVLLFIAFAAILNVN